MACMFRLESPGAIYHVTGRGNERKDLFRSDADRLRFLEKLAESFQAHPIRLHAYVLMSNHFHLLLETPRGNLSAFLHQFHTNY
jgi:putative transposase